MNTLTLYLYLMDILGNLQGLLIALCVVGGGIFGLILAFNLIEDNRFLPCGYFGIPIFILMAIVASLIPSKSTMQLMAVSEAGEMVVTNPEVRDVLNDVKEVFKKQLDDMKKD